MGAMDSTDDALIKYLLNEQSEEENEELEDRMVLDPELADRAQVVEMKLIDSYVLDQMSPSEKDRFEKGFFLFPENHDKVEDARAFHENLRLRRETSVEAQLPPPGQVSSDWFISVSRIQIVALTAVLILITAVVIGVFFLLPDRQQPIITNDNNSNTRPDVVSNSENSNNNNSNPPKTNETPSGNKSNPNYTPVVSIVELRGRVNAVIRGTNNTFKIITPHLIKIPVRSEAFTLKVSLMPHEYFKQNLDCSVDVTNAKFERLFPKGDYMKVKAQPVEGEFPYQVEIKIPAAFLKQGTLYYFRLLETDSLTPFKVKFTG